LAEPKTLLEAEFMERYSLSWEDLGDVRVGRPNLGPNTTVMFYRLMQMSLATELAVRLGREQAGEVIKAAGDMAGRLVYGRFLGDCDDMPSLVRELTRFLRENNVGILRVEDADEEARQFAFTIREDLDCSGTPNDGRFKCKFDEGFVAGILGGFFDRDMAVDEVECWGRGQTTCRFVARPSRAPAELRLTAG
jgi:uncharacterized protein